jgi:alpha-glucosidase/alpha-D-xyloside xylohydrolase
LEGAERLGPNWIQPNELHDAEVEKICRNYLNLRYRLLPYLYSSVAQTHETGLPLMRSLWLAYPADREVQLRDAAYLFGDSFLVAPVLAPSAREVSVYLPAGQWWDFWSGSVIQGGKEKSQAVDLHTIPLYVRAGSIVPIGPLKQYVTDIQDEPLTLRIYPGADGSLRLYEDDGESFRYREGAFTRTHCAWNDDRQALTLHVDPKGQPATGRKMQVEVVGRHPPVELTLQGPTTEIRL